MVNKRITDYKKISFFFVLPLIILSLIFVMSSDEIVSFLKLNKESRSLLYTSDLTETISEFVLKDMDGNVLDNGSSLIYGQKYNVLFTFSESNEYGSEKQFQYNDEGYLTYTIPDNFMISNIHDKPFFTTTSTGELVEIGKFSIDDNSLLTMQMYNIDSEGNEITENYIDKYNNVSVTLSFEVTISGSDGTNEINIGNGITMNVDIVNEGYFDVTKEMVKYDNELGIWSYEVVVKAVGGEIDNVSYTDVPCDEFYLVDGSTVIYNLDKTEELESVPTTLLPGEGFVLTYDLRVHPEHYVGDDQISIYLSNDFEVTGTVSSGESIVGNASVASNYVLKNLEKEAYVYDYDEQVIEWEIEVRGHGDDLEGVELVDTLGEGLTFDTTRRLKILAYDENMVETEYRYTDWSLIEYTDTQLFITLPKGQYFEISYMTHYDMGSEHEKVFDNTAVTTLNGREVETSTEILVIDELPTVEKTVESEDSEYIYYQIKILVPQVMYNKVFRLLDALNMYSDSAKVNNEPLDLKLWAETDSGTIVNFNDSRVTTEGNYFDLRQSSVDHDFYIYFNTLMQDSAYSFWPIEERSTLYVTYKIAKNATLEYDSTKSIKELTQDDILVNQVELKYFGESNLLYENCYYTDGSLDLIKEGKVLDNGEIEYTVIFDNRDANGDYYYSTDVDGEMPVTEHNFIDTFDERFEYVPGSLKVEIFNRYDGYTPDSIYAIFNYSGEAEGNVLKTEITDWVYDESSKYDYYTTENGFRRWIKYYGGVIGHAYTYRVKPKDVVFSDPSVSKIDVVNTAQIRWVTTFEENDVVVGTETTELDPVESVVEYNTGVIKKNAEQLKYGDVLGNIIEFSILLNQNTIDINPNGDYYVVEDDMSSNLTLLWSTVKVYENVNSEWVEYSNVIKTLDSDTNTLSFTLPDNLNLKLVYRAVVSGSGAVEVSNNAKISGYDSAFDSVSTVFSVSSTVSSASGSEVSFYLLKQDLDNNVPLPGAEFALFGPADGNKHGTPPEGLSETMEVDGVTLYYYESYTSGSDGTVKVGESLLTNGALYALVEYKQPEGYVLPEEPVLFYFNKMPDGGNEGYKVILDQSPLVVYNELIKYELPETGGFNQVYYLLGGILVVISGFILVKKKIRS